MIAFLFPLSVYFSTRDADGKKGRREYFMDDLVQRLAGGDHWGLNKSGGRVG
jgi:hypothetical protein